MAERPRIHWSQLRLGVVVTAFAASSALAIFFIDQISRALEDRYTLHFHTFTLQKLGPRSPVWLAGHPVGSVRRVEFLPPTGAGGERLRVELSIATAVRPLIPEGSTAQIITTGLVGQTVVNIVPAPGPGPPLGDDDYLPTAESFDPLDVRRRLRSLGDSVEPLAQLWREVLRTASEGDGTIARLRRDRGQLEEFRARLAHLTALFDTLGSGTGGLSRLLADDSLRASWHRLGPRLGRLAERLNASPLRRAMKEGRLAANLDSIAVRAGRLEKRIEEGHGSLGRFLHDRTLSLELRRTREMLRELRDEFRALSGGASRGGR